MPARKKPSPAKAAAARANGAKSRGPKTAAGKKQSSRNSLKHGARCSSRTPLLLPGEDPTKLQLYTDSFYQHFRPKDLVEAAMVDIMIAQIWKTARITGYESEILTSAAEDLHHELTDQYDSITAARLFALAFRDSAETGRNPLPLRYLVSCRNMFRSALTDLIRLRQVKAAPEESYIQPPTIEPVIANFCIDPEALPVSGLGAVTTHTASPAPYTRETPDPAQPEPERPFQPQVFEQAFEEQTFDQPQESNWPPEPEPQPVVAAQPEVNRLACYPMLPLRDRTTGAIIINMTGKPMWIPNPDYIHKPGVTPPLFPFANETFDFGLFPEKHHISTMLREGLFHDDVRMNEDALPNEPKPPATVTNPTASSHRHQLPNRR